MAAFYTGRNNDFQQSSWQSRAARIALGDNDYSEGQLPPLPKPDPAPEAPLYDVFIAGSGPIGATYARQLVGAGYKVVMVDVGDMDSPEAGSHKKNNIVYQKDINKFVNVIQGALSKVSVPPNKNVVQTLGLSSFRPDKFFVKGGNNPDQNPFKNLPGQAVTRVVGGMATHWTCAVPRFHSEELPRLMDKPEDDPDEWSRLYKQAEEFIGKGETQFAHSIRHQLVLDTLKGKYDGKRTFQQIPLACKRQKDTNEYVQWSSANTIFDMRNRKQESGSPGEFSLLPGQICRKIELGETSTNEIGSAVMQDLLNEGSAPYRIKAKVFILAAGAICNPQILVASGFASFGKTQNLDSKIPNLGSYITEQTMAFCQTVFREDLIREVTVDLEITGKPGETGYNVKVKPPPYAPKHDESWNNRVIKHMMDHQDDPIPIPLSDPEPQVTTLFSGSGDGKYPWHTQIHRDAFSYGAVAESIDSRLIVDWRFFGRTQPEKRNKLYFSDKYIDNYGMPQPTFDYSIEAGSETAREADSMMLDMVNMSANIGGFLPGSEPQFMEPGLALHLGGSHRSGLNQADSVVDTNSKVWNFPNLFLGGVGNIPTAFGSNPTLTAMCYAIKSCEFIKEKFPLSDS